MRISDWSSDVCASDLKRSAPSVSTGMTWAPASPRRRQTAPALYAAIPPEPPRTIRLPSSTDMTGGEPRSEERRVGKEWGSTCKSEWWQWPKTIKSDKSRYVKIARNKEHHIQ